MFGPRRRDSLCGTGGLMWHLEAWQIASKSRLWAQMSPWSLYPALCVCLILSFPNLHWTDRTFAGLSTMYHPVFGSLSLSGLVSFPAYFLASAAPLLTTDDYHCTPNSRPGQLLQHPRGGRQRWVRVHGWVD